MQYVLLVEYIVCAPFNGSCTKVVNELHYPTSHSQLSLLLARVNQPPLAATFIPWVSFTLYFTQETLHLDSETLV
jgi:hypothetical protein